MLHNRLSLTAACTWLLLTVTLAGTFASPCSGQFPASNIEFLSQVPLADMGGGLGSDLWGWTDPLTGREYALATRWNGTSFVDVTDPFQPVYLGELPTHTAISTWRDVKTYQNYAYIVADGNGPHGMQIFDLTNLRGVTTPQTFTATAHFSGFRQAHNIAINEESGFAYAIATEIGNLAIGLADPLAPVTVANVLGGHDLQAVTYDGPDEDYVGREINFVTPGNDRIIIQDVTDKQNPVVIADPAYPGGVYSHQGWLSEDSRFFYVNDERDTMWTHIWDVADLDQPGYLGVLPPSVNTVDHNLFVRGNYLYAANYTGGLHVFEIDATTGMLDSVGWLDTYPSADNLESQGAWAAYPFFESNTILINDRQSGLIVARLDLFDGDFDHNGELDCQDIDALTAAVAAGNNDPEFDINQDGVTNLADRDAWLAEAGSELLGAGATILVGDANLDGVVDGVDFSIWNDHKFTLQPAWCSGDFDMNGAVDGSDFVAWNANKFQSSSAPQTVPEPLLCWYLWLALLPIVCRRP